MFVGVLNGRTIVRSDKNDGFPPSFVALFGRDRRSKTSLSNCRREPLSRRPRDVHSGNGFCRRCGGRLFAQYAHHVRSIQKTVDCLCSIAGSIMSNSICNNERFNRHRSQRGSVPCRIFHTAPTFRVSYNVKNAACQPIILSTADGIGAVHAFIYLFIAIYSGVSLQRARKILSSWMIYRRENFSCCL